MGPSADYPMVAPNYAAARSHLRKANGSRSARPPPALIAGQIAKKPLVTGDLRLCLLLIKFLYLWTNRTAKSWPMELAV